MSFIWDIWLPRLKFIWRHVCLDIKHFGKFIFNSEVECVFWSCLQGLLFLLCALCPPDVSKVRVGKLTPYGIETLRNIRDFLGVKFVIKPDPTTNTVILKCVGSGMKNLSRKISWPASDATGEPSWKVLRCSQRCSNVSPTIFSRLSLYQILVFWGLVMNYYKTTCDVI